MPHVPNNASVILRTIVGHLDRRHRATVEQVVKFLSFCNQDKDEYIESLLFCLSRFRRLDDESRKVVMKMLDGHVSLGLGRVGREEAPGSQ